MKVGSGISVHVIVVLEINLQVTGQIPMAGCHLDP
jgi:hypothetical protein